MRPIGCGTVISLSSPAPGTPLHPKVSIRPTPVQIPEPMGPSAAQIVSWVRDFVRSSAIRGSPLGRKDAPRAKLAQWLPLLTTATSP